MKKLNGIKLKHFKGTENCEAVHFKTPSNVKILMSMNMGTPCTPLVKKGDEVFVGQKIGDSDAFFSVPVHSSVSGKVTEISDFRLSNGSVCKVAEIETDGKQTQSSEVKPPEITDKGSFLRSVRESGACGLGGAGFPTHIKLNPKNEIDTLIINAAECEPYITSDYRLMVERPENVIGGIRLIMKQLNIKNAIIGIEDNKPEAIKHYKEITDKEDTIDVCILPSQYPQGAEKVLIYTTTGRIVMEGELPSDQKVIVLNVSTIAFLYKYTQTGIPLIRRRITVEGDAVKNPRNVIAPIGTSIRDLLIFAETDIDSLKQVIVGGPMMGSCILSIDTPITKTSNSILAVKNYTKSEESSCIRCGRCIKACPLNLMPTELERAYKTKNIQALIDLKIMLCMNCGCCTYVCPANRKLAEVNQIAKFLVPKK